MYNFTDEQLKDLANYLTAHKISLRKLSKLTNIPKSTLHSNFHKRLPSIDFDKYEKLQAVLDENFADKHIRGGESTKEKYKKSKHNKKENNNV